MLNYSPIVLFVYDRPDHTLKTLEALQANIQSKKSKLFIYSDGPKPGREKEVNAVREIINSKNWCGEVEIIKSEENKGLAKSIVEGVTEVIEKYDSAIILEDDIVTSPRFLEFMNAALHKYKSQEKVMHISGFIHTEIGEEAFFSRPMFCWGWATWKRAWKGFDINETYLPKIKNGRELAFDFNGVLDMTHQLDESESGLRDTWAVKWSAFIFLNDGLCLNPNASLVRNIGHDGTGANSVLVHDYQNMLVSFEVPKLPEKLFISKAKNRKLQRFFARRKGRSFYWKYLFKNIT